VAEIFVKNSLGSHVSVKFNVTIKQFTITTSEGDPKWLLEVGTTYPDANGDVIPPKLVHLITLDTLEDEIEKAVSDMCLLIDWGALENDTYPPYIDSYLPSDIEDVLINTRVTAIIKERLPSSGLDLSSIKITLDNGMAIFDITNDVVITGDPYEYKIEWVPPIRALKTYGD
jgi:hypothetical protein